MVKQSRRPSDEAGQPVIGAQWEGGRQEVLLGLRDWRARHPKATFGAIEEELDRRLHQLRAQMLADLALASTATTLDCGERPVCPACGGAVHDAGVRKRTVRTVGNQPVTLHRDYATCPRCGVGLFPPGR
jgi:hypothetical protein